MKSRELILANLILVLLIGVFGWMAFKLSVNPGPPKTAHAQTASEVEAERAKNACSKKKALDITNIQEPHLKRLSDYQATCASFATDTLMVFTGFSQDIPAAEVNAVEMAEKLKSFHQNGVNPIVVAEPYIKDQAMSFKTYLSGAYDAGVDHYFKRLKELGVTDQMMGMWVPFPEPNTPSWNNKDTEPRDFAKCVNKYLGKLREYFPSAQGSVLLNATTYAPNDSQWENGDYISLTQYVDGIDANLVKSVGIQGFPWMTNAEQRKRTIFDANEFIQPDLAIGMAQVLRTRDIWINSGTFASKYTNDPSKTVHLAINERKALLHEILQVAVGIREYQQNEYRVSINLFSEDKSDTKEATDWSYFQNTESQTVLKEFLVWADDFEIPVSLYDKAKWQLQ